MRKESTINYGSINFSFLVRSCLGSGVSFGDPLVVSAVAVEDGVPEREEGRVVANVVRVVVLVVPVVS